MVALYVTSPTKGSGKTAICAALARQLTAKGKKVSFFRPVIAEANKAAPGANGDPEFMKQMLSLSEPAEQLSPSINWSNNPGATLKDAYAKVSQGKDVVLVEGRWEQHQLTRDVAAALNATVLVIEAYSAGMLKDIENYKRLGQSLVGVVLNKVPKTRVDEVRDQSSARLKQVGVSLVGVLPEDRNLLALTVGELAASIGGEIVLGAERSAELVENLMLPALGIDPGPMYYGRKSDKAALLRADRPDTQLAALETSTRCLVLAGGTKPMPIVIGQARGKNVAIITTKDPLPAILPKVEAALVTAGISQSKIARVAEVIQQLDLGKLYRGLGIA